MFFRRDYISLNEAIICVLSPVIAVLLRGASFDQPALHFPMFVYVVTSILGGGFALYYVQISKLPLSFLSFVELQKIFKVAVFASISGVIGTYFATQMVHIPRLVPIIHFFVLFGLLIASSVLTEKLRNRRHFSAGRRLFQSNSAENLIIIGCNSAAAHYAAIIDDMPELNKKVAGLVSTTAELVGTMMVGRIVVGPSSNIIAIMNEFKNHGVEIHRIVVATQDAAEKKQIFDLLFPFCEQNGIAVSLLSDVMGGLVDDVEYGATQNRSALSESGLTTHNVSAPPYSEVSRYLLVRQRLDWIIALLGAIVALPLIIFVAIGTYFDVGRPLIFWQKRVGRYGYLITVNKFRTLPHVGDGAVDGSRAPSKFGLFLQRTRLDELPQIFDILAGNLSFIGPRPLLRHDLPSEIGMRNAVRPGITGWAQVHGGKNVTPEEKMALDHWYLGHASFSLDLLIIFKTLVVVLRGKEQRDEDVIRMALAQFEDYQRRAETEVVRDRDVGPEVNDLRGARVLEFRSGTKAI